MNTYRLPLLLCCFCLTLAACSKQEAASSLPAHIDIDTVQKETGRWYSQAQVEQGRDIFARYCASCHGTKAEATTDWKTPDNEGRYPPPPLNGSAHAWHHPIAALTEVIQKGGALYGGQMPAWEGILSIEESYAAIASFQHYWSDEVYERWLEIEKQSRE